MVCRQQLVRRGFWLGWVPGGGGDGAGVVEGDAVMVSSNPWWCAAAGGVARDVGMVQIGDAVSRRKAQLLKAAG
jgi:hypothetical protein